MILPFIEIIESVASDPNLLMWKFADQDKEIKNGANLTVRESQHAMLLNEGQLADIFTPGLYSLSTENIPILSRLKGWKYGFKSPFKADVYFFNTHQFINNKWGTPAPILMKDSEFGQIRIRAFGSFDVKIVEPSIFFREYAGTYKQLTIFELQQQLRDYIAPSFGEILANEKIPVTEVAGNISKLSKKIEPLLKPYFLQLGIELTQFVITSITLPEEVLTHYDKITSMNMVTDIDKFTKFNTANAISQKGTAVHDATQNALTLGIIMSQSQQQNKEQTKENKDDDLTLKLEKLKALFDADLINEDEFKAKKIEILSQL